MVSDEPVRLPIVYRGDGWLAVAKPPGVAVGDSASENHTGLLAAMQAGIAAGGGQFRRLGFEEAAGINDLETGASGVVLVATNRETAGNLRNDLGSDRITFVFELITEGVAEAGVGDVRLCNLPLAWDNERERAFVSQRVGRKCSTSFTLAARFPGHSAWRAETNLYRSDQIRVHAREIGLRIVGEDKYVRVRAMSLAGLKGLRLRRDAEVAIVNQGLCLHLAQVRYRSRDAGDLVIDAPRTRSFDAAWRFLVGK
ncbi:MAG: hypothetical protein ACREIA_26190 [Opitutaceae bacterium]